MKMVINCDYGGFHLPENFCEKYGMDRYDKIDRTDKRLVSYVEANGRNDDDCLDLCIIEIPDTATDWDLEEYDGLETIIYVVDGKIHYAG